MRSTESSRCRPLLVPHNMICPLCPEYFTQAHARYECRTSKSKPRCHSQSGKEAGAPGERSMGCRASIRSHGPKGYYQRHLCGPSARLQGFKQTVHDTCKIYTTELTDLIGLAVSNSESPQKLSITESKHASQYQHTTMSEA
jgi:hypothetical protein